MGTIKRIGILTAGGDCPGLNAVIRAVAKYAILKNNIEVVGIFEGFGGLLRKNYRTLGVQEASGILAKGGTILGASNRDNPFRVMVGKDQYEDQSETALQTIEEAGLDALVCVGGDGTMHIAQKFRDLGVPVVGVPKTIDNDLDGTDQTFGFDTAASIVADAVVDLHTTAEAHHRVMIVETMGRYAGWLALAGGLGGAANVILIPELPYEIDVVVEHLRARRRTGKKCSIIAIAEGAKEHGGGVFVKEKDPTRTDPVRLGGVGHQLAWQVQERGGPECRVVVLGHLQRAGRPTSFDRILATRFGVHAVDLVLEKNFGRMVSLRGPCIESVPISEAIAKQRLVPPDHAMIQAARAVDASFGQ